MLIAVVVIGLVVGARLLTQASDAADRASEIEVGLNRRLGRTAGEEERDLAAALREASISADAAASVVAALRATFGAADLSDLEAAGLLAAWEESDTAPHDSASRTLSQIGNGLGVTREGFADFVRNVTNEVFERQLPPAVILAGLFEHWLGLQRGVRVRRRSAVPARRGGRSRVGSSAGRVRAVGPR